MSQLKDVNLLTCFYVVWKSIEMKNIHTKTWLKKGFSGKILMYNSINLLSASMLFNDIGEKGIRWESWAIRSLYLGSNAAGNHCTEVYINARRYLSVSPQGMIYVVPVRHTVKCIWSMRRRSKAKNHKSGNLLNSSKVKTSVQSLSPIRCFWQQVCPLSRWCSKEGGFFYGMPKR